MSNGMPFRRWFMSEQVISMARLPEHIMTYLDDLPEEMALHLFASAQFTRRERSETRAGRRCGGGRTPDHGIRRPDAGAS